jgi:hypothetical protein
MAKPEQVEKKRKLVPLWIGATDNPVLARMARRPVLIAIDELGIILGGQARQMTAVHACVLPLSLLLLRKSVYVEIMFRYENTVYSLSGRSSSTFLDNSFWFEFDTVARKTMDLLGGRLLSAGLLDNELESAHVAAMFPVLSEPREMEEKKLEHPVVRRRLWPKGRERRVHRRFDIEAAVRLTVVQKGHLLECEMVNLSLSGCRLRFAAACDLECGSFVEMQFIGNGLPLRLAAIIQVRIDAHTVGMRFVRTSARMLDRLEDLIAEIEEGRVIAGVQG